jgi:hypothetical protein
MTALLTGIAALAVPGTNGASLLPAGLGVAKATPGQEEFDPSRLDSLNASDPPGEVVGKHRTA